MIVFSIDRRFGFVKTLLMLNIFFIIACNPSKQGIDYTQNRAPQSINRPFKNSKIYSNNSRAPHTRAYSSHHVNRSPKKIVKSEKRAVNHNVPSRSVSNKARSNKTKIKDIRYRITSTAEQQIGTPYKYGGSTPRAFDCSGLTQYCLRQHNIEIARSSKHQSVQGKRKSLTDAEPGDLVFFGKNRQVSHVGIVSENTGDKLYVIHSSSSKGVIKQDVLNSNYWKKRILYVKDMLIGAEVAATSP